LAIPHKWDAAFPFIDQEKDLGYMREREEKKKEKNREEESPEAVSSSFSYRQVPPVL
jgi:hypothetical protein